MAMKKFFVFIYPKNSNDMDKEFFMSDKSTLIITTNTSKVNEEISTGVWLEEFAVPYLVFRDTGYDITVASPLGGISPVDEKSYSCSNPEEWDTTKKFLDNTVRLSTVNYTEFDCVYFPGGHGPMFDLPQNDMVREVVEYFYRENKVVAAVCHGPCALLSAKKENGESILKGKRVTSFTNREENIVKMDEFMPFLLQSRIEELGAEFEEETPWSEHVEVDGNLITGQNQNSALLIAEAVVDKL